MLRPDQAATSAQRTGRPLSPRVAGACPAGGAWPGRCADNAAGRGAAPDGAGCTGSGRSSRGRRAWSGRRGKPPEASPRSAPVTSALGPIPAAPAVASKLLRHRGWGSSQPTSDRPAGVAGGHAPTDLLPFGRRQRPGRALRWALLYATGLQHKGPYRADPVAERPEFRLLIARPGGGGADLFGSELAVLTARCPPGERPGGWLVGWLLTFQQPHVGGLGALWARRHVELDGLAVIK
jgi:hypothetical protein